MTIIVNAFAGPGAGKSTISGGLFNKLKEAGYNVEYVQEFAKTLTWEKNFEALKHQCYVTGVQQYTQNMLLGQVEAIITDSPIPIGLMYYTQKDTPAGYHFFRYVIESFKEQNNLSFFIERTKPYNPSGRNQSEDEAKRIDADIKELLDNNSFGYKIVSGDKQGLETAYALVVATLENQRRLKYE